MKVMETLTNEQKVDLLAGTPVGIFTTLFEASDPWIDKAGDCCAGYYLYRSGGKETSPIFDRITEIATEAQDPSAIAGRIIRSKFIEKWNKVYSALIQEEYQVLNEHESTETKTGNNTDKTIYDSAVESDGNSATSLSTTTKSDSANDVYGFNSVSPVGQSETNGNNVETVEGEADKNTRHSLQSKTGTDTKEFGIDEAVSRKGRNTAGADLIQKELKLRRQNIFFDIVYGDIDSILALQVYI